MRLQSLVPMLQTTDVPRTRQWYETVLGFKTTAQQDGWCHLARDDIALMFMQNDHLGEPEVTGTQYIYVDDVMELWNSIKDRCLAEWGPERMDYGMLEFAIKDPNGYLLSFGQPIHA
jgi:catechol 2,3-dioxygenase-like lactoylglutathione lyase family enzyme